MPLECLIENCGKMNERQYIIFMHTNDAFETEEDHNGNDEKILQLSFLYLFIYYDLIFFGR